MFELLILSLIYFKLLDYTNKPKFLRKYKIQPETNEPVDPKELRKVSYLFVSFVMIA